MQTLELTHDNSKQCRCLHFSFLITFGFLNFFLCSRYKGWVSNSIILLFIYNFFNLFHAPIITRHEIYLKFMSNHHFLIVSRFVRNIARLTIRNKYLTSTKWQKLYFINNHQRNRQTTCVFVCVCRLLSVQVEVNNIHIIIKTGDIYYTI